MGRKSNTLVLSPWSGGLNSSQDPIILGLTPQGQQYLAKADNVVFSSSPGRVKRGGQAHFNSSALTVSGTAVDGIYATTYWFNSSSNVKTEELVVVTEGGGMFRAASYGTPSACTFSGVTPTFSQGQITSDVMNEKLFIGYSKTATPLVYIGAGTNVFPASASTAVVGTFPPGYVVRQHQNRLWIAGDAANPDRLSYSASELPFAYGTAGGFIDVAPGDGDPEGITAIFPSINIGELYVAKREKLYKIITSDPSPTNWALIRVSNGIGCIQHNSAVAIDQGDILFASDRGIHSLQQILTTTAVITGKFLSAQIQGEYKDASNKKFISAIWAPDLNSYLFGVQREGTTIADTIYGLNIELGAWYRWTSVPVNFLFRRLNISTGLYEYYTCGDHSSSATTGFINKLQQTNEWDFNSSTGNISTVLKTPLLYPNGNFLIERNWLNIIVLARSTDSSVINVSWKIDEATYGSGVLQQRTVGNNLLGSSSGFLLGSTFILGSPSGAKPLFLSTEGVGNGIEVTLMHDTIGKNVEIYGLALEFYEGEESEDAYRTFPAA